MPAPPPADALHAALHPPLLEAGRLAEDRYCRVCGYNMHGLRPEDRCPECNLPIGESLLGDELRFAAVAWLRTVTTGFRLLNAANVTCLVVVLSFFASMWIDSPWLGAIGVVAGLAIAAAIVAALVGFVLATRIDPAERAQGRVRSWRRTVRALLIAPLVLTFACWSLKESGVQNAVVDQVMRWSPVVSGILWMAAALAFTMFILELLDRTSEDRIRRSARSLRTLLLGAIVLVGSAWMVEVCLRALQASSQPARSQPIHSVTGTIRSCGSCLLWIALLSAMSLIAKVSRTLKRTLAEAEQRTRAAAAAAPPPALDA